MGLIQKFYPYTICHLRFVAWTYSWKWGTFIVGFIFVCVCLTVGLSPKPLHPAGAPEEGAPLHRATAGAAPGPLCVWVLSHSLHEDGLPTPHYAPHAYQVSTCISHEHQGSISHAPHAHQVSISYAPQVSIFLAPQIYKISTVLSLACKRNQVSTSISQNY